MVCAYIYLQNCFKPLLNLDVLKKKLEIMANSLKKKIIYKDYSDIKMINLVQSNNLTRIDSVFD